jgi:hypothetical protein
MPTPLDFMQTYRNLKVNVTIDDPVRRACRQDTYRVQLRKYFMMNWTAGTAEMNEYDDVTSGGNTEWFRANRESIQTAAMGKGAPHDYELALEWVARSKKVPTLSQGTLQTYCDTHLGIDCSGFATNYLIAAGKKPDTTDVQRNTGASSYFNIARAVNDASQVRAGDLLVWMTGNSVKTDPGHVMVVNSYDPQSRLGGNMQIVEATGASAANPKLTDSMYTVEQIVPKGGLVPVMILVVKRFGVSGNRVCVMRW